MTSCNGTALMCAACKGHAQCVEALIAAGADIAVAMASEDEFIGGGAGMTALDLAKAKGHGPVADLLGM
jgi:ankyrin repeat protein